MKAIGVCERIISIAAMPAASPTCPSRPPDLGSAASAQGAGSRETGLEIRYKNSSAAQGEMPRAPGAVRTVCKVLVAC
jgi:hypothetical protein